MSDLSVSVSGVEEGENVTLGTTLTLSCSVEDIPGISGLDWRVNR